MEERKHYSFFTNRECEFFPCHKEGDPGNFNCLFCYCPLYALGKRCGGSFNYMVGGIKDCTNCTFPHRPENYEIIVARYTELSDVVRREDSI